MSIRFGGLEINSRRRRLGGLHPPREANTRSKYRDRRDEEKSEQKSEPGKLSMALSPQNSGTSDVGSVQVKKQCVSSWVSTGGTRDGQMRPSTSVRMAFADAVTKPNPTAETDK